MNEKISQSLRNFANNANFSLLHPLDWDRFYDFIITSFNENVKISEDDFEEIIKEKVPKIAEEWINDKYILYEHGIELLKKHN